MRPLPGWQTGWRTGVAGPVVARVPLPGGDATAVVLARRLEVGGVGAVAIVGSELGELAAVQGDSEVSLLAVPAAGADPGAAQDWRGRVDHT